MASNTSSPASFWSGTTSEDVTSPLTEGSLFSCDHGIHESGTEEYILVVGGCGFIGSHTVWELAKAGHNVIVIDNLSNSFRSVFETIDQMVAQHYKTENVRHQQPTVRFHEADFTDEKVMTAILKSYARSPVFILDSGNLDPPQKSRITGVIHFAAYKSVGESIQKPMKYYMNNFCGLVNFCSLLEAFGIKRIVFSSSATVYGTVADLGVPLREELCSHDTTTFVDDDGMERQVQPGCSGLTNPYGRTKWMCEAFLSDLAKADPEWNITCLRYFNPIGCDESGLLGEDPRNAVTNLMPVLLRVITGKLPVLNIYGTDYDTIDGSAVRDYIHVTDLARAHSAALNSKEGGGFRVYNVGSGRGSSVLELIEAVERASKIKIPTQLVDRRKGDVGSCVARAEKAEIALGWKAAKTLDDSCCDVWRFLESGRRKRNHS